jgi:transposase
MINKRLIKRKMKKEKKREQEKAVRQNVGIDVSKEDFKVAFSVLTESLHVRVLGTHTFRNAQKGFEAFREWLGSRRVEDLELHLTLEATGVYYEGLAYFLHGEGHTLHVVLPNLAKKYAQSLGLKSKTDRIDARMLSRMGLERELRTWQPASPGLLNLKQLTRERDTLVRSRTVASNHLHAFSHQGRPNAASIERTGKHIEFMDSQIKQIEKEMTESVKRDETLCKRLEYLTGIPGVGLLTAIVIVAETHGFACVTNIKQLTAYAGLDVRICESGKWKGQSRISKRGNSHIRGALYMPALAKIRADRATEAFYERLKEKKGRPMIALVAVQRKLLGLMYTLWKKQEAFDPEAGQRSGSEEHRPSSDRESDPLAGQTSGNGEHTPSFGQKVSVRGTKKLREQQTSPTMQDRLQFNVSHESLPLAGDKITEKFEPDSSNEKNIFST